MGSLSGAWLVADYSHPHGWMTETIRLVLMDELYEQTPYETNAKQSPWTHDAGSRVSKGCFPLVSGVAEIHPQGRFVTLSGRAMIQDVDYCPSITLFAIPTQR
jgi:hypothetical protein